MEPQARIVRFEVRGSNEELRNSSFTIRRSNLEPRRPFTGDRIEKTFRALPSPRILLPRRLLEIRGPLLWQRLVAGPGSGESRSAVGVDARRRCVAVDRRRQELEVVGPEAQRPGGLVRRAAAEEQHAVCRRRAGGDGALQRRRRDVGMGARRSGADAARAGVRSCQSQSHLGSRREPPQALRRRRREVDGVPHQRRRRLHLRLPSEGLEDHLGRGLQRTFGPLAHQRRRRVMEADRHRSSRVEYPAQDPRRPLAARHALHVRGARRRLQEHRRRPDVETPRRRPSAG